MMQADPAPRRYEKKSEWADTQAAELQARAYDLLMQSSGGSSGRAARKFDAVRRLEAEAGRFRSIAQALRRRGK